MDNSPEKALKLIVGNKCDLPKKDFEINEQDG